MTPAELRRVGKRLYGAGWARKLAAELHVDASTVYRWARGETRINWLTESAIRTIALKKQK